MTLIGALIMSLGYTTGWASEPAKPAMSPEPAAWAEYQYQIATQTQDPIARRLLLEHLLQALTPAEDLWFRIRGALMLLEMEQS